MHSTLHPGDYRLKYHVGSLKTLINVSSLCYPVVPSRPETQCQRIHKFSCGFFRVFSEAVSILHPLMLIRNYSNFTSMKMIQVNTMEDNMYEVPGFFHKMQE
jgi:hypothetical protein